jgi:hypothetical protein
MLVVSLMLGFWPQFTGAILAGASEIAGMIDLTTLDKLQDLIDACAAGLEHPPVWNFFGLFVYIFVLGGMVCLDATLLLITGLGFFAVGLGQVFGPLVVTFLLIPGWSGKFWRWVDFMWIYSWYRAVAAAYVWVASNFLINFFQNSVNGDYSLGHFAGLALLMLSSILMVVFGAFKVPAFTAELFGGGLGHAGANFGESVRAFVYMVAMG